MADASSRYIIPAGVTLANAACGFVGLLVAGGFAPLWWPIAPDARLAIAAWLVFAGWGFDMIDGTVAKALNATSGFGGQLDSLCDAVTFGVLPGLLIVRGGYAHPLAVAAGFVYMAAVLVRLARFNQENTHEVHLYFKGLSSPSAAMTVAAATLAMGSSASALPVAVQTALPAAMGALAVLLAGLMVSDIRYADLPKHYARKLAPWWRLLPAVAVVVLLPLPVALFVITLGYVLGGIAGALRDRVAGA